jgi:hypothetical protein
LTLASANEHICQGFGGPRRERRVQEREEFKQQTTGDEIEIEEQGEKKKEERNRERARAQESSRELKRARAREEFERDRQRSKERSLTFRPSVRFGGQVDHFGEHRRHFESFLLFQCSTLVGADLFVGDRWP